MKVNKENLIEWLDDLADNIESKDYKEVLEMNCDTIVYY